MKDISTVPFHATSEKLAELICKKTQSKNILFFRVLIAYQFAKVASMMRCDIKTLDRGDIPVNMYAINLAPSGAGKGHSNNIIEESVLNRFTDNFTEMTLPTISEGHLSKLAINRAARNGTDEEDELVRTNKEFASLGKFAFSFDSGTTAAIKQMRQMLLMANCGSMCLEIDEIGSNLLSNVDILATYLELYDVGNIKQKLTKNTAENTRSEEIRGRTPANMMLYGTPDKVLDGGKIEEELFSFFDTGYSRRCLFSYSKEVGKDTSLTPEQVFDMLTDTSTSSYMESLSKKLGNLADPMYFQKKITITKDVTLTLIEYKLNCEAIANAMPQHEGIRKAEMTHRYFKALKLAGAYAFIDGDSEITEDTLYSAIKLVEVSGESFSNLLTRDRNYVKLAKYIAATERELTHVDLVEDLPFYKGSESQKRELMTLAIAYGYKNNIIIKKFFTDGIEFLQGESLKETNLDELILAYSTDITSGYKPQLAPFSKLEKLTTNPNLHWVSHHLREGYRDSNHVIPKFNMIVLDVDEGSTLKQVRTLLANFTYHIYTTKRHTDTENRFRVILPMSHILSLEENEYKEFMSNIYEWLPFDVDTQTGQRSRKWSSFNGKVFTNEGELVNSLLFIPKTAKNEERKQKVLDQNSLSNIERWFINNTGTGNRSNNFIRYALMMVDSGLSQEHIHNAITALNSKLKDKMDEAEILGTIMTTVVKEIAKR